MTEVIPHNRNRLGVWISRATHPLIIFIPTLIIVLKNTPLLEALGWISFIALLIFVPATILLRRLKQQGKQTYQREARHLIYVTFWVCMVMSTLLALVLGAPSRLLFSLLCLCIWVPLQYAVNARFTKISVHVAVISGIMLALLLMGELSSIPWLIGAIGVVLATAWARLVTGHHSLLQVSLGITVSTISVLLAFGLLALFHLF
ncbi:MAG TPA: hypothetical protein VHP83_06960 [Aggregatilineaceae bacterium]|nr:hypothetical protein [Aggregatilineaceae bacterium]